MKGMSLIELLLALLITTLILSSLITIYLATYSLHHSQVALTTIQENSRVARSLLSNDIKMAGYAGCAKLRKDYPLIYSPMFSLTPQNKILPFSDSRLRTGSAGVTIRHVAGENAVLIKPMIYYSLVYVSPEPHFSPGDLLSLSDCQHAELFVVKELVTDSNGTQRILTEKPLHFLYRENSEISRFNINSYFIEQTRRRQANGRAIYALYKQDIKLHKTELIEGVEDMQIKYAILEDAQLYERTEKEINDWSKVVGVSIMLVLTDPNSGNIHKNEYIYVALRTL